MHPVLVWRNFRYTANGVPWVWLLNNVTIRSALHCYRTRNTWLKCASSLRMRVTLLYWPLFYTYFAIDFSERAIPANIDRSILLTARMGRYDIKVSLLRCLIRLIIIIITRCYIKANSFVQFLCPKFALTCVEFALTSSRYSYGINPIVGIRLT